MNTCFVWVIQESRTGKATRTLPTHETSLLAKSTSFAPSQHCLHTTRKPLWSQHFVMTYMINNVWSIQHQIQTLYLWLFHTSKQKNTLNRSSNRPNWVSRLKFVFSLASKRYRKGNLTHAEAVTLYTLIHSHLEKAFSMMMMMIMIIVAKHSRNNNCNLSVNQAW